MQPPARSFSTLILTGGLFFCSGLSALLLQTLWLRKLGVLLGNTAIGATIVLTVFFLGLALGSFFGGRRAERMRPLRLYAILEGATALFALLFLLLEHAFVFFYSPLTELSRTTPVLFPVLAFLITLPLLLPATICMGANLPVISAFLKTRLEIAGQRLALFYALNILGGALGVLAASFWLPQLAGYNGTYALTLLLIVLTGGIAYGIDRWSRRTHHDQERSSAAEAPAAGQTQSEQTDTQVLPLRTIAFASGFVTIACEVLWIRLFARILQNSIYTYAVVLLTILIGLGIGSLFASIFSRSLARPKRIATILIVASLLIVLSPILCYYITDGFAYFGGDADWFFYLIKIFALASVTLLGPAILLGLVLPLLFVAQEDSGESFRRSIGDLAAFNTVGAIGGAAVGGFIVLPWLGLFGGFRLLGLVYPALLLATGAGGFARDRRFALLLAAGVLLPVSLFDPGRIPAVRFLPAQGESLVQTIEGPRGQAAVIQKRGQLRIKLDNHYTIGGSGARAAEELQAHLPLLLHPDPRHVFVLGMGTGITAGAVLQHPVQKLTVAELVPEMIELSREHFKPYTNNLFDDPRARILAADGRWLLRGEDHVYDVIMADLFTPWKSGVGDLYTREHFETTRKRLRPDGLFVQWLPLYQMTDTEFGSIARAMLTVFPRVTLWRGDFFPKKSIVALIGHANTKALDPQALRRRLRESGTRTNKGPGRTLAPALNTLQKKDPDSAAKLSSLLVYYAGDLSPRKNYFAGYPPSTDDFPSIQFRSPVSMRRVRAGRAHWLTGTRLLGEFSRTLEQTPLREDSFLSQLEEKDRRYVEAGLRLHRMVVFKGADEKERALEELRAFKKLVR